jgi:hypothetical protein
MSWACDSDFFATKTHTFFRELDNGQIEAFCYDFMEEERQKPGNVPLPAYVLSSFVNKITKIYELKSDQEIVKTLATMLKAAQEDMRNIGREEILHVAKEFGLPAHQAEKASFVLCLQIGNSKSNDSTNQIKAEFVDNLRTAAAKGRTREFLAEMAPAMQPDPPSPPPEEEVYRDYVQSSDDESSQTPPRRTSRRDDGSIRECHSGNRPRNIRESGPPFA